VRGAHKAVGIQYAVLPYRVTGRRLEVLLITSRESRRWVIPKGWPMPGMRPQEAAVTEAAEEAGVIGEVEDLAIGSYRYLKRLKGKRTVPVQVIVFPFEVTGHLADWKEQGQRHLAWRPYAKAAAMVAEPHLKRLILDFGAARRPGLVPSRERVEAWLTGLLPPGLRR
jgi:8-oxo-dGTP pyrophosphatase MutT (NUDIX family)